MTDMPMIETDTEGHIRLTRRDVASMFFAGYALAAVSADASPIITNDHGLHIEEPLIPNGAPHPLPAYLARPDKPGRHPVIIVVNEVFGIHAYIKDICRRLAHLGYVAVAPAFFYRSGVDLAQIPMSELQTKILPVVMQASDAQVDADVAATTHWLKAQSFTDPHKIGITGFCWGGSVVWRAAMTNPDVRAGVAWYGRLEKLKTRAAEVRVPVLGLYGALDHGIPQSDVHEMEAGLVAAHKTGSSIHVYPDADHGFHADYRPSYNAKDAADGWARMLAHFKANGVG